MLEGFEQYIGRTLKPEFVAGKNLLPGGSTNTRPPSTGPNTHINMLIRYDEDYKITDIFGDKCISVSRGLYDRSANVYDRPFTKRELDYFHKYILRNSDE